MTQFFSNFPIIEYNGQQVVDITKNIRMAPNALTNPFAFFPYTITESIRSDQLANLVYGDPYLEWMVFLSNQTIDPYGEWYMDENQFTLFIEQKYSSWDLAQNKIKYYINNWYNGETLSLAAFDSLSPVLTKYFQPQFNADNTVIQYVRTQIDWIISTNHLVQMTFTNNVPIFMDDEIVNIQYDVGVVGNGQVAFTSNTQLSIQHVIGNYLPNNNVINVSAFSIIGQQSGQTITISNTNQISINTVDTLNPLEDVYYDAVSYYDYENNINEQNKTINLIGNNYVQEIVQEISTVLSS
jgi:hypothetical protein